MLIIPRRTERGIEACVTVLEGRQIDTPVHPCFGLFEQFGVQNVILELTLKPDSRATFWSHCLFTTPAQARHAMTATVDMQSGWQLTYNKIHYHGLSGGIEVIPHAQVSVGERACYVANFALVRGRTRAHCRCGDSHYHDPGRLTLATESIHVSSALSY